MTIDPVHTRTIPAVVGQTDNLPEIVDRRAFETGIDQLRAREKALTCESDAIAAARRRMPMVEIDGDLEVTGQHGPARLIDAFEGRRMLIAYYMMWHEGEPASGQCEGCTWNNTQVTELSYLNTRDITYAVICQGPYDRSRRYRDFMGWNLPWWSAQPSLDTLLVGRQIGSMHLVCYLRADEDRVFETYWTTGRGVEVVDYNLGLMDLTAWGRQESWEDSPAGWPQPWGAGSGRVRSEGRPIAQWTRIQDGRSDDLS